MSERGLSYISINSHISALQENLQSKSIYHILSLTDWQNVRLHIKTPCIADAFRHCENRPIIQSLDKNRLLVLPVAHAQF